MEDVKWIKIYINIFENPKIKNLRSLKNGNTIVLFWVMLLTAAGRCNENGDLFLTAGIPYTAKSLSTEFNMRESVVKNALQEFENLNMISYNNGVYSILGWTKYQNIDGMDKIREQNKVRKRRQRTKEKSGCKNEIETSRDGHVTVTQCHATDIEIDIEERNKNILSTTIKAYEQHIGAITQRVAEAISDWIEKGADSSLIIFAFEQAVEYNARSWKYAEKIISTHFNAGRKTRSAAENFGNKKTSGKKNGASYELDDMAAMERKMRLERMNNNA